MIRNWLRTFLNDRDKRNLVLRMGDAVFRRWHPYLRWRRRRPRDYFEYPPLSNMPQWPQWAMGGHRDGFYIAYTRLVDRFYCLGMYFNAHHDPPFRVEIERWGEGGTGAWANDGSLSWSSLRQHDCATLEQAESLMAEWRTNLEQIVMEAAL